MRNKLLTDVHYKIKTISMIRFDFVRVAIFTYLFFVSPS